MPPLGSVTRPRKLFQLLLVVFALVAAQGQVQSFLGGEVRMQTQPYVPTFHAERTEVGVDIVVRDGKGDPIPGLTREQFQIQDEGKQQQITSFAAETNAEATITPPAGGQPSAEQQANPQPQRSIVMYFDDLHMAFGQLRNVQLAAEHYVKQNLAPGDRIAVFTASNAVTLDFSASLQQIEDAIGKITAHDHDAGFGAPACPHITAYEAYLIAKRIDATVRNLAISQAIQCNCGDDVDLSNVDPSTLDRNSGGGMGMDCARSQPAFVDATADQVWEQALIGSQATVVSLDSVIRRLAGAPGTRVLVLTSSGFPSGSLESNIGDLVDLALRSQVVINSLDATGIYAEDPSKAEREVNSLRGGSALALKTEMQAVQRLGDKLATATAGMANLAYSTGGLFFHNSNDMGLGYRRLAAPPAAEYRLTFTPNPLKKDGRFHRLKVSVSAPGALAAQWRPGYFAPDETSAGISIDERMNGRDSVSQLNAQVSAERQARATGTSPLQVRVHLEISDLPFQKEKGRYVESLLFVAALFDPQGNLVTGKKCEMILALRPETYKKLSASGINTVLPLYVAGGEYVLRTVVEEVVRGRVFASAQAMH